MTNGNTKLYNGNIMKERDTDILAVRIKKTLLSEVKEKVTRKKVTRNGWIIGCIKEGLRLHKKRE